MTTTSAYPDLVIDRGGNTFTVSVVTIGATASVLVAANPKRQEVWLRNTHATQTIHLGSDGTVTGGSDGFELKTNGAEIFKLKTTDEIYAISDNAGTTVEVIEISHG